MAGRSCPPKCRANKRSRAPAVGTECDESLTARPAADRHHYNQSWDLICGSTTRTSSCRSSCRAAVRVLWDNLSFTRFGDLREFEPIPTNCLIDASNQPGGSDRYVHHDQFRPLEDLHAPPISRRPKNRTHGCVTLGSEIFRPPPANKLKKHPIRRPHQNWAGQERSSNKIEHLRHSCYGKDHPRSADPHRTMPSSLNRRRRSNTMQLPGKHPTDQNTSLVDFQCRMWTLARQIYCFCIGPALQRAGGHL